jgi:hypothetical protein
VYGPASYAAPVTRRSLSQTQELRPLDTQELETSEFRRPRGAGASRYLALAALVAVAVGAGVILRRAARALPPPEELVITPGTVRLVVEFRTASPCVGRVELRRSDEDPEPESVAVDPAPVTHHRLLVRIPSGEARQLRAVTDGGATLSRTVQAPAPWRLRRVSQVPPPGDPGLVEFESRPPTRGEARLILAGRSGTRTVEVEGAPGQERIRLPAAKSDELAEALAYDGTAVDGEPVSTRIPLLWGGTEGAASKLASEYARANREYEEVLLEPSEEYSALGIPVSAGARRRPPPEEWYQRLDALQETVAWVRPVRERILADLGPELTEALYREASWSALFEAAYARDEGGPAPRLEAKEWATGLVPPAPPEGGDDLLPPGEFALFPARTGLPGTFFQGAVSRVQLRPVPPLGPAKEVVVWAESGPMPPEFALLVHFGRHLVLLTPSLIPTTPAQDGIRLGARVPASWLKGPAWVEVTVADGTFFPAPLPLRALHVARGG